MANNINYIPQVDYTSRDYVSIREDLVALASRYTPEWSTQDTNDLGIVLLDTFAYLGDLLSFYIDRSANEGLLPTASQRTSILQIASVLGYSPVTVQPATVTLTFSNSNAYTITVPAKTQVATTSVVNGLSQQIIFETASGVTVPAASGGVSGTVTVTATQGPTVSGEVVGTSDGTPSQSFALAYVNVVISSIAVTVNGISYLYVSSLSDYGPYDYVFTTVNDGNGYTYVIFGDGVNGRVPTSGQAVNVTYNICDGSFGNVPGGSLTSILPGTSISPSVIGLTVTNLTAATSGADEESNDSIRFNAARALKASNRAVSLKDYANLALQVPTVAKANADAATYNSVTLYIVPTADSGVTSGGSATTAFNSASTAVSNYFLDKTPPNMSLTITTPTYVPVDIEINANVLSTYSSTLTYNNIVSAITDALSSANSYFAEVVTEQFILNTVRNATGVDYASVALLRRKSADTVYNVASYARTGNIVTVTTTATHTVTVGQQIRVSIGVSGIDTVTFPTATTSTALYAWNVSAVTSNTISFATLTSGTIGSTSISVPSSTVIQAMAVETITCAVNEIPTLGNLIINTTGGI